MQHEDIRPIAVADPARAPGADAQALIAAALTLMTAYAVEQEEDERASVARQIGEHLRALESLGDLGKDFRRICGRLQALWEAQAD
jgi:hypothetical protein